MGLPVWKPAETPAAQPADGNRTAVKQIEHALPLKPGACELVTDGDKRPVLILRECDKCKGTDHALLSRTLDNEQTVLLAHWFRCVKLPPNVLLTSDHPFYNLFKREERGRAHPPVLRRPRRRQQAGTAGRPGPDRVVEGDVRIPRALLRRRREGGDQELRQVLTGRQARRRGEPDQEPPRLKDLEENGPDSDKVKEARADLVRLPGAGQAGRREELRDLA